MAGRCCATAPARPVVAVVLLAVWMFCDCLLLKGYQMTSIANVRRISYNSMSTYDDTTLSQIYSVHSEVAAAAATNTSNVSTISEHTSTLPIISFNNNPTNLTANLKWDNTIQLVISVDASDLLNGLVALLQSISQHSSKNNMTIHIVVNTRDREKVQRKIACSVSIPEAIEIRYLSFDIPESFRQLIIVNSHSYLASTANFARFYFDKLFPNLPYILYIDVDTLVLHNLQELWNEIVGYEQLLAVVERPKPNYGIHFPNQNFSILYQKRYNKPIDLSSPSFNAGVLGFNLNKWRRDNVTNEVIYWMRENQKAPLWFQGTQPILFIVGYKDIFGIDSQWNVDGLGWNKMKQERMESAYILHWSGPDKPWADQRQLSIKYRIKHRTLLRATNGYKPLWKKYYRKECSHHGTCKRGEGDGEWACECKDGHHGKLCGS